MSTRPGRYLIPHSYERWHEEIARAGERKLPIQQPGSVRGAVEWLPLSACGFG
jgi:hypothetical protein